MVSKSFSVRSGIEDERVMNEAGRGELLEKSSLLGLRCAPMEGEDEVSEDTVEVEDVVTWPCF